MWTYAIATLSAAQAYALASFNVDFRVGEAVNNVKMIYGVIPKKLFGSKPRPEQSVNRQRR